MTGEVVILGSGTSNGVPMPGINHSAEFLANPKNHRTRPSILIKGPTGNLLVDCAPEMRLQVTNEKLMSLDGVIITHTHADHIMGMDDLRSFCIVQRRSMPVYALPEHQEVIRRVFEYAFRDNHAEGLEVPRFELQDVPHVITVGGLRVQTMVVMHGPMCVTALRVNNFAYVTDVNEIPPAADAKLKGLDVLVLDAVRYRPHPSHFHYDAAIAEAKRIGAKMTYFNHLSADYDHDKVNAELPDNIKLSYDGQRIPI